MSTFHALLTITALALLISLLARMERRRALKQYWDRACMGLRWRRRFPDVPKTELREFLTLFVDAFCFAHQRRTCFSPTDQVMEVYQASHPRSSLGDSLELETLGLRLEERYGIDFAAVWREDITLGELYEHTKGPVV